MSLPSAVLFGSTIRLQHTHSHLWLRSIEAKYLHVNSSGQKMVVGSAICDEHGIWRIKPGHDKRETATSTVVHHGDTIRLENLATHLNLHSHGHGSPFSSSHNQQEVTGYFHASPGVGDLNDDWVVELDNPSDWKIGDNVRLRHSRTSRYLHLNGLAHPQLTEGFQEITAIQFPDASSRWNCVSTDLRKSADTGKDAPASFNEPNAVPTTWPSLIYGVLGHRPRLNLAGGVVAAAVCFAAIIWVAAHLSSQPGTQVKVLFGVAEYTRATPGTSSTTSSFRIPNTSTWPIEVRSERSQDEATAALRKSPKSLKGLDQTTASTPISRLPAETYSFVQADDLKKISMDRAAFNNVPAFRDTGSNRSNFCEVQKANGVLYLVLFVDSETATKLRASEKLGKDKMISLSGIGHQDEHFTTAVRLTVNSVLRVETKPSVITGVAAPLVTVDLNI